MIDNRLKAVLRKDFLAFSRKAIQELEATRIDKDPYLEISRPSSPPSLMVRGTGSSSIYRHGI